MASKATSGKGTILTRGNGADPEVFTRLAEVTSIDGPELSLETIDVSNMDSEEWREFIASLKSGGELQIGCNFLPGDVTHLRLQQDFFDTAVRNYRVEFPDALVAATLATGTAVGNNGITWTAVRKGAFGNAITVALVNPGVDTGATTVAVVGKAITVTLEYAAAAIAATASDVIAAIEASSDASELVTVADTGASTGASVVAAVAATALAGGRGTRWILPALVTKSPSPSAKVDGALSATASLKVSGKPTFESIV